MSNKQAALLESGYCAVNELLFRRIADSIFIIFTGNSKQFEYAFSVQRTKTLEIPTRRSVSQSCSNSQTSQNLHQTTTQKDHNHNCLTKLVPHLSMGVNVCEVFCGDRKLTHTGESALVTNLSPQLFILPFRISLTNECRMTFSINTSCKWKRTHLLFNTPSKQRQRLLPHRLEIPASETLATKHKTSKSTGRWEFERS